MTNPVRARPRPLAFGRGVAAVSAVALVAGTIAIAIACIFTAPAQAARPVPAGAADIQPLAVLLHEHVARTRPSVHGRRIEAVPARRPLTRARTVLPVLGRSGGWLRVRLPGRPNGHSGWISTNRTRSSTTEWGLVVDLSARQVTVYRDGKVDRRFEAVVGKASTPTPRGRFFVEEALALSPSASGGPFALATSARSRALHEFDGGPGQIALHGTDNLVGTPGTAVSHGCIRLSPPSITWLARRIGAGVPVTIIR